MSIPSRYTGLEAPDLEGEDKDEHDEVDMRELGSPHQETAEAITSPSRKRGVSPTGELQLVGSDEISHSFCGVENFGDSEQNGEGSIRAGTSTSPEPIRPAARRAAQQLTTHIPEPAYNKAGGLERT